MLVKSLLALGVSVLIAIMVWWALHSPVAGFVALILCRLFFGMILSLDRQNAHFLIHADQQGFMKSLKLADKTALFDGSQHLPFRARIWGWCKAAGRHGAGVAQ
ncbi:hypothetical protein JI58_00875 [Marinosulfonomonas sp. PRT-SC04]|nr:hypothetical protein JI58_00875 [Marinosulfonomonas sp. PRT-SC04]